jgi:hypothetical protein
LRLDFQFNLLLFIGFSRLCDLFKFHNEYRE